MELAAPIQEIWQAPALGGALIGLSAGLLWIFIGRIFGVSGIFHRLLSTDLPRSDRNWRIAALMGLVLGGFVSYQIWPEAYRTLIAQDDYYRLALAGLIVGFGTRLGGGCTSGHGVCGIGRLSVRSIAATIIFIASGMITVWITGGIGS